MTEGIDASVAKEGLYFAYSHCKNCGHIVPNLIPLGTLEKDYFIGKGICSRCGCLSMPTGEKKH